MQAIILRQTVTMSFLMAYALRWLEIDMRDFWRDRVSL
jgi:hypothetical protein